MAPKQEHCGLVAKPGPTPAAPNLPGVFVADPHPLHQDKMKMRLISWGTTARRDRWQKHPATSRVYLSLAEKVRNQAGVSPAPRRHCRAAAPSTTSTASSMGKGWFSFQKAVWLRRTRLHRGARARRCPTGLRAPPRDAPAPRGWLSLADAGSLLRFQPSNGNQHQARCGCPPAPCGGGVRVEAGGEGTGAAVALGALPLGSPAAKPVAEEP